MAVYNTKLISDVSTDVLNLNYVRFDRLFYFILGLIQTVAVYTLNFGLIMSQYNKNLPGIFIRNTTTEGVYETTHEKFVIDCSKKYYFVSHGFNGGYFQDYLMEVVDNINAMPNSVAYYLYWGDISRANIFPLIDIAGVGNAFAKDTLLPIYEQCKTPYVYLMSFSLGSHMMGYAGRALQSYGYTADVIMGCDPSGPVFQSWNLGDSIGPGDAKQVITTHTNAVGLGSLITKGKLNIYFNGGGTQPGCSTLGQCSHRRSVAYFNESIVNPTGFVAYPCMAVLGIISYPKKRGVPITYNLLDIPVNASGDYCIDTNSSPPFAMGPTWNPS